MRPGDRKKTVYIPRRKKRSPIGWIAAIVIAIAGLWVAIVFLFPFFEHWIYLKFFLVCIMAFAFLGISYLLRT